MEAQNSSGVNSEEAGKRNDEKFRDNKLCDSLQSDIETDSHILKLQSELRGHMLRQSMANKWWQSVDNSVNCSIKNNRVNVHWLILLHIYGFICKCAIKLLEKAVSSSNLFLTAVTNS
uniref:Uncharacterized protein n=1 Tax=Glossina pallidipes TaxID=7398 RepID=A0A1A9ZFF9_GLOPL